jgi:hypothetical protein
MPIHSGGRDTAAVTVPYTPGPSGDEPPTAAVPAPPRQRRISKSNKIALTVLVVILGCCSGTALWGSTLPNPKTSVVASPQQPVGVATGAAPTKAAPPVATSPRPALSTKATTRAPTHRATHTTRPRPRPTKTTRPPAQHGVHPGAFCSPQGAIGYTDKGTRMRCTTKSGDSRARWRSA